MDPFFSLFPSFPSLGFDNVTDDKEFILPFEDISFASLSAALGVPEGKRGSNPWISFGAVPSLVRFAGGP
jgi:hypothetical protein